MDFTEVLQYPWAYRALIASCLVGLLCGSLGVFIVLRNMALIGDALAHAILPGIVVAFVLVGYSTLAFFIGAVAAGLITAVAITWIQHSSNTKNDAAIGIAFTAMFAIGVIGISRISRNEGVHLDLKDFLFGNILGVSDQDLMLTGTVAVFTIMALLVFYRPLFATTFQSTIAHTMGINTRMVHYFLMLLLSFAVVAALRTVGVILVVAMLITPAATALLLARRLPRVLILASGIGLLTALTGFYISVVVETTPGPAMTVCATGFYLLALVFAPERGILSRFFKRRTMRRKVLEEDILKRAVKPSSDPQHWLAELNLSQPGMNKYLQLLSKKGLMQRVNDQWVLTATGQQRANEIIRAHRLWETYLVEKAGMTEAQIHLDAEALEHSLNFELLDEIEELLGYPSADPHGSPIPQVHRTPARYLDAIDPGEEVVFTQPSARKFAQQMIAEHPLSPAHPFTFHEKNETEILLTQTGKEIALPRSAGSEYMVRPVHSSSGDPI